MAASLLALALAAPPHGAPPLCEPSAATRAPWDPGVVLVADNEIEEELFAFRLQGESLVDGRPLLLPPGDLPHDVEALVATDGGELLVVGSHSRNQRCEAKKKRKRLLVVRAEGKKLARVRTLEPPKDALSSEAACLAGLFAAPPPSGAAEVCAAIAAAERAGGSGPCPTLNVEAAAATGGRIWLGLRSPLAGSRAVLLRLVPGLAALRFDAVAFAELGGRGIREALADRDALLVVAGPTLDQALAAVLVAVPLAALAPGAPRRPGRPGVPLPPSAEGIVVAGDRLVLVVDGARGDDRGTCEVAAGQLSVERPLP